MDKENSNNRKKARTGTYSLGDELFEFIDTERAKMEAATGIEPTSTDIVRKALKLLKKHTEGIEAAQVALQESGQRDLQASLGKKTRGESAS